MSPSAEALWRLNQEYVNRLLRARNYLDLLEQLVIERGAGETQTRLLNALQFTSQQLNRLSAEHRGWCYTFFYESPETKRIVQTPNAIRRALTSFEDMRERHQSEFDDLAALFYDLPRPIPAVTRIPNGDLWDKVQAALHDLVDFSPEATR